MADNVLNWVYLYYNLNMNRKAFQTAGYVLLILGLIGMFSGMAPAWSRYTVLILGIIIVLVTASGKSSK